MSDNYGSVLREKMKESMAVPFTPMNRRIKPRVTWWGAQRDAIISVIVAVILFLILWGDIHLFAVGVGR